MQYSMLQEQEYWHYPEHLAGIVDTSANTQQKHVICWSRALVLEIADVVVVDCGEQNCGGG